MTAGANYAEAADWSWGDVAARAGTGVTRLTHTASGAQLQLRDGRCERGPGYDLAPREARQALARIGALLRLRSRGRYLLHAAGVVDPLGRAWLFAGDSGCGKSTLAYALARAGWPVLGDDGVPVEIVGDQVVAHAWRAPLRVSAALASHFPELSRLAAVPGDGRARVEAVAGSPLVRRAPVAALILPVRAAHDVVERLPAAAALAGLIRQSPWALLGDADAIRHVTSLRDLAASVPAFRLEHSPTQLHRIADTLFALRR